MTIEWKTSNTLIPYEEAIAFMEERVAAIYNHEQDECIWYLEHPPLYTAGTSADPKDLLQATRFPVYETGRGGEFTYHGPGQLVVYTMLDLNQREKDLRRFVFLLEEWIIQTLAQFNIEGERREGRIGIWVEKPDGSEAKIAAIGVRVRKWVTYHGLAININPDLEHFSGIVPCGIKEHGVTSFKDLGIDVTREEVQQALTDKFFA